MLELLDTSFAVSYISAYDYDNCFVEEGTFVVPFLLESSFLAFWLFICSNVTL